MTMSEFLPKLLAQVYALPAARPLIARLGDGTHVYLVGGAVRDLLLGGAPVDLDLVVEGDAATVVAALGGEVREHDRFGTATVVLDGFTYDIARARRETYDHPGALPDVEPAPLAEDLRRRDFTVNAIAIPLAGERAGELTAAAGRARGSRGAPAAGSARRELHRRPHTAVPPRPLREPARLRDRAPHAGAGGGRDCHRRPGHGQRPAHRSRAQAARRRAGPGPGARRPGGPGSRCRRPPGVRARGRERDAGAPGADAAAR